MVGHVSATYFLSFSTPPAEVGEVMTFNPLARKRAVKLAPITPVAPMTATVLIPVDAIVNEVRGSGKSVCEGVVMCERVGSEQYSQKS